MRKGGHGARAEFGASVFYVVFRTHKRGTCSKFSASELRAPSAKGDGLTTLGDETLPRALSLTLRSKLVTACANGA